MLDEMGFPAEAEAFEQGGGGGVFGVGDGEDAVGGEGAEHEIEEAFQGFGGVAVFLMNRTDGDAEFHLLWFVQEAMQSAVAHDRFGGGVDDGELEPGAGDVWLRRGLLFDEARGVIEFKG